MKRFAPAVVAMLVLAALATGCAGEDESPTSAAAVPGQAAALDLTGFQPTGGSAGSLPGITVLGSGSAPAVPDVADWSFGVQADAESAAAALRSASQATRRILDALREAGIARDDLRTEQVSLYPRTTDDGSAVIGYSASSSVYATVRDLGRAGEIVDAAVGAGANQLSGPNLRVSEARAQYQAAVEAALDDARSRAEAVATKAGVTLGAPIAIVESSGAPPVAYEERVAADAAASVPIEPGRQEVMATLSVTFAIA